MEQARSENPQQDVLQIQKKGRHRKKQLYNSILHQMEFYFSDSNLSKDRFLSQLLQKSPYVELSVFLRFNKIKRFTSNLDDLRKAIRNSELLELSEDSQSICRKTPIKVKDNVDNCTIYLEKIKADATHEWLTSIFSEFGNVVYVSIPKYKQSSINKGFAFIEFDTEKEAEHALEFFESIGCKMPSHLKPEDLCSILTFEKDKKEGSTDENEEITSEHAQSIKKRKRSTEDVCYKDKRLRSDDESSTNESRNATVPEDEETTKITKKKLKKEHKKRNDIKDLGLQVLSKREWKKMRNHYLDSQRKKMKEFKLYLHKKSFGQQYYNSAGKESSENWEITDQDSVQQKSTLPKVEFTPGVIVRIKLTEVCNETTKLKNEIKSTCPFVVKYIDLSFLADSQEVYMRFSDPSNAQDFCKQECFGEKTVLLGKDEEKYWEKIGSDRQTKLKRSDKKQRGRDKLLKKAAVEMAKHTRFDDEN